MRRRRVMIIVLLLIIVGVLCVTWIVLRPQHPTDIAPSDVGWIELSAFQQPIYIVTDREQIEKIIKNFNETELGEGITFKESDLMIGSESMTVDIYKKNGERYRAFGVKANGKISYNDTEYETKNPSVNTEYLRELMENEGDNLID